MNIKKVKLQSKSMHVICVIFTLKILHPSYSFVHMNK